MITTKNANIIICNSMKIAIKTHHKDTKKFTKCSNYWSFNK